MSLVKCWYHYFFDRQASNNFAAYLFLSYIGSILATSWFQAGCHPRRLICKGLPRQVHPQPVSVLIAEPIAIAATNAPPKPPNHQYFVGQSEISAPKRRKL